MTYNDDQMKQMLKDWRAPDMSETAPSSLGGADGSAEHPYDYDPPPLVPDGHLKCFSRELLIESARRWMRHHAEGCSQEWHMARLGLLIDFVTDLYDGKVPPNAGTERQQP